MAISDLLAEAGLLMLIGMIVVFVFLTLLIFATTMLSKLAGSDTDPSASTTHNGVSGDDSSLNAPAPVIAAITAAIHSYKQNKK